MYDVIYLNRATRTPGLATDLTTGSRRYALERAATLRDRGIPAHVQNIRGERID